MVEQIINLDSNAQLTEEEIREVLEWVKKAVDEDPTLAQTANLDRIINPPGPRYTSQAYIGYRLTTAG